MMENRTKKDILSLAILFGITFLWLGIPARIIQGSYTQNYQTLAFELAGKDHEAPPQQWIEKWMWHKGSPYKYRILGKLPVWLTWKVIKGNNPGKTFYWIYLFWLFVFAYAAITALYFYLKTLFTNIPKRASPFAQNIAFGGSILFCLIPAFFFAFKFPGHTKVIDLLAYFLLTLGVHSIIKRRLSWMIMISSIGIFCHETLLIVPLIYLIVGKETFMKRCLYAGIPFIIWFVYRMVWWGMYNPLIFSKRNFIQPFETVCFFFLVFGFFWITGAAGYKEIKSVGEKDLNWSWEVLKKAFLPVSIFVILSDVLLTRLREIRIIFILFIFILPFTLYWLIHARNVICRMLKQWSYWIYAGFSIVASIAFWFALRPANRIEFRVLMNKAGVISAGYGGRWLEIFCVYFAVALLILPFVLQYRRVSD